MRTKSQTLGRLSIRHANSVTIKSQIAIFLKSSDDVLTHTKAIPVPQALKTEASRDLRAADTVYLVGG
jgi:hypothetical protein